MCFKHLTPIVYVDRQCSGSALVSHPGGLGSIPSEGNFFHRQVNLSMPLQYDYQSKTDKEL